MHVSPTPPPATGPGRLGAGRPAGPPPLDLDTLARGLGVSREELLAARENGQALADFAADRGIGEDALRPVVKRALEAAVPSDLPLPPAGTIDDLAERIASGAAPTAPSRHGAGVVLQFPDRSVLEAISGADAQERVAELLRQLESAAPPPTYTARGTASRTKPTLGLDALA